MRRNTLRIGLLLVSLVVFRSSALPASSPARTLEKVHYEQYVGPQMDWPRSTEPTVLVQTRHGMPVYEKLPSRPYRVLGTMSDEGELSIKHVINAARVAEADAILVVGDKAFAGAGLKISPQFLEKAEVPDPRGPRTVSRLEHPEVLRASTEQATIRVTRIAAILIRWTTK